MSTKVHKGTSVKQISAGTINEMQEPPYVLPNSMSTPASFTMIDFIACRDLTSRLYHCEAGNWGWVQMCLCPTAISSS